MLTIIINTKAYKYLLKHVQLIKKVLHDVMLIRFVQIAFNATSKYISLTKLL